MRLLFELPDFSFDSLECILCIMQMHSKSSLPLVIEVEFSDHEVESLIKSML